MVNALTKEEHQLLTDAIAIYAHELDRRYDHAETHIYAVELRERAKKLRDIVSRLRPTEPETTQSPTEGA